ncbi:prepilin-type N-terminal cleavage/methylation domain-containing protein [Thermodesulfobacteriota bacterium]
MQMNPKRISGKQRHTQQARAGFTLLEILVAMSIITFALIAIFRLYTQTISMNHLLSFNITAPFLAQKKMAEQTSMPGKELGDDAGNFGEEFPGYTWAVFVEDVISEVLETEDLKKIDVRVSINTDEYTYFLRRYRFLKD